MHQTKCGEGRDTALVHDFKVEIKEDSSQRPNGYKRIAEDPDFTSYVRVTKVDKQTGKSVLKAGTVYQIYKVNKDGTETLVSQSYSDGTGMSTVSEYVTDESGQIMTVKPLKLSLIHISEPTRRP